MYGIAKSFRAEWVKAREVRSFVCVICDTVNQKLNYALKSQRLNLFDDLFENVDRKIQQLQRGLLL